MLKYLPYIVIVILLLLLFSGGGGAIKPPTKVWKKDSTELKPIVLKDTIEIKGKTLIVEKENPINKKLLNDFKQLQDSIKRIDMYKDAIEIRTYRETFKTGLKVESKVQGTLLNQKVTIPPTKKYHLFAGVETSITTKPVISGKIYLQKNRTIYTLGYNSEKQIEVGVAFKLF